MAQTFEAVCDSGIIRLPTNIRLPDHTKVYVVVPETGKEPTLTLHSPHLVHTEQAIDFVMEVVEEHSDAPL